MDTLCLCKYNSLREFDTAYANGRGSSIPDAKNPSLDRHHALPSVVVIRVVDTITKSNVSGMVSTLHLEIKNMPSQREKRHARIDGRHEVPTPTSTLQSQDGQDLHPSHGKRVYAGCRLNYTSQDQDVLVNIL